MAEGRRIPAFAEYLRRSGIAALWDQRGVPDQCRKLDSGDYTCD
jgi:hypothetical protein